MALVIIEICLLVLVFGRSATVVPYNDVKSDYETLITAYRTNGSVSVTNVMPNDPTVAPIAVYLGMSLYAVMDYDGVSGRIQLVASMDIEWFDEVKVLTGTTFKKSLQTIFVPYDQIWTPNLVLINAADSTERIGDATYKVRYNVSSGYCKWNPRMIINAACTPDMTYYPFDKQTCILTVSTWFRDNSVLNLVALTNEWNIMYLEKSGIWDVRETSTVTYTDTITGLYNTDFKITVKRKPLFLALVIVLPVLLLSLLTGFVFLLPPGSGSRVGFGITCFLSFIVLLQIVMNVIPEVSAPMPLLCFYIVGMLAFSVLLNITNVFLLKMYLNSSKNEVPHWLLSAVQIITCKILRRCPKHPKPKLSQPIPGNITRQDTVHNIRFTGRSKNDSEMFKFDKNNEIISKMDKDSNGLPEFDKECEELDTQSTAIPEFCEDKNQELGEDRSDLPEFDKEGREFPKVDTYSKDLRELNKEHRNLPEVDEESSSPLESDKEILDFPEVYKVSSELAELEEDDRVVSELDNACSSLPGWDKEESFSFNSDSRREHDKQKFQNTLYVVENSKQLHRTTLAVINSTQFDHDDNKITPVEHPSSTLQTKFALCSIEEKTTTRVSTPRSKLTTTQSKNDITWEYIAQILDTFFLIIFSAVQIIFTIVFLVPCVAQN